MAEYGNILILKPPARPKGVCRIFLTQKCIIIFMKKNRCFILIDGSNFYFKLRDLDLHRLINFDFTGFVNSIAGKRTIVWVTYYVGKLELQARANPKRCWLISKDYSLICTGIRLDTL